MSLSLSIFLVVVFVFVFVFVIFFGHVMYSHHYEQMPQRSQVSRIAPGHVGGVVVQLVISSL